MAAGEGQRVLTGVENLGPGVVGEGQSVLKTSIGHKIGLHGTEVSKEDTS